MSLRRTLTSAAGALAVVVAASGCQKETPVMMWVDGFQPENVRFEVEDLGPQTADELRAIKRRPDVDGALLLPPGSCGGPCRAAIVSVFVNNKSPEKEPPPVVRLAVPEGKPVRMPIVFQASDIDPGRIGRIRWLVEMWPDETKLTTTLSSSVRLVVSDPKPTDATTPPVETPSTTQDPKAPTPAPAPPAGSAAAVNK